MVGYKRPKNIRDLIVRADVRLKVPKERIPETQSQKAAQTLMFPNQNITSIPKKQTSMLNFLKRSPCNSDDIHASTSLIEANNSTPHPVRRSMSLTLMTKPPNLVRNKCISKKQCRYCPKLNTTGKIKCTATSVEYDLQQFQPSILHYLQ